MYDRIIYVNAIASMIIPFFIEPLIDLSQQVFNDAQRVCCRWYYRSHENTLMQIKSEYIESIYLSKQSRNIAHYI